MAKKTKPKEAESETLDTSRDTLVDDVTPAAKADAEASAASFPRLESYINQHDDTPRALATVRLEGGGSGDGMYLVDHPVPRTIGHRAARYVISREEGRVTVYIWVNP